MTETIDGWRLEINELDQEIIALLEKRFELVGKIGSFKKLNALPVRDEARERALIEKQVEASKLAPDFIRDLYRVIFSYSYQLEQ